MFQSSYKAGRVAYRDRVWRNILGYNRSGADDAAVSDRDAGQDATTEADPDVVADFYRPGGSDGGKAPWLLPGSVLKGPAAGLGIEWQSIRVHNEHLPRDQCIIADFDPIVADDPRSMHQRIFTQGYIAFGSHIEHGSEVRGSSFGHTNSRRGFTPVKVKAKSSFQICGLVNDRVLGNCSGIPIPRQSTGGGHVS